MGAQSGHVDPQHGTQAKEQPLHGFIVALPALSQHYRPMNKSTNRRPLPFVTATPGLQTDLAQIRVDARALT